MNNVTDIYSPIRATYIPLPVFTCPVQAGVFSPAEDYLEETLDLNDLLIQHPAATFMVRVRGDSMKNAGIYDGSILVVDCKLEAVPGKIVLAVVNGEFTVKRYVINGEGFPVLRPENEDYSDIPITEETTIRGIVTGSIVRY
jgi:DNA polymerase V